MPIDELLNISVNSTLSRSVITHVTVTLALLSLLFFGGPAIHSFTAAMTFGAVLVGSYTSIFIAAPILIYLGVGTTRRHSEDTAEPDSGRAGSVPWAMPAKSESGKSEPAQPGPSKPGPKPKAKSKPR
jgi:preprotein translocase subunit SecF